MALPWGPTLAAARRLGNAGAAGTDAAPDLSWQLELTRHSAAAACKSQTQSRGSWVAFFLRIFSLTVPVKATDKSQYSRVL